MISIDEKFKAIVDGESVEVDALIRCMSHSKKNEARRFLMLMNHVVDFYLQRAPEDGNVRFPIIYLPNTPSWAEPVWLNFLILKLSLFYNNQKRVELQSLIQNNFNLDGNGRIRGGRHNGRHLTREVIPLQNYMRGILGNLNGEVTERDLSGKDVHKNILFCNSRDFAAGRGDNNRYVEEFYGEGLDGDDNLILCQDKTAEDITIELRKWRKNNYCPLVDNIFMSYTNNDLCKSMGKTALNDMNRYGMGLKNCFVFYFSQSPHSIRMELLQRRKNKFCSLFPEVVSPRDVASYEHFIFFTDEEMEYVFGSDFAENCFGRTTRVYLPDDQILYNDLIGNLIDNAEYPILERNLLSLCLDEQREKEYVQEQEMLHGASKESYQWSLDYQLSKAPEVVEKIKEFIGAEERLTFVLPYDVVLDKGKKKCVKAMLKRLFPTVQQVGLRTLSDMRGTASRNIPSKKFVVLTYRRHGLSSRKQNQYPKYPNSCDPYPVITPGQEILQVIQGFAFDDIYQWDKYNYESLKCDMLRSAFRKERLTLPAPPKRPEGSEVKYDDNSDEERPNVAIVSSRYNLENGDTWTIPDSEPIICSLNGEQCITRMSVLKQDGRESEIYAIQRLDDLIDMLKTKMGKKVEEANVHGETIRNRYLKEGLITEEEKNSQAYLWKILLSHKVAALGAVNVYEELMGRLSRGRVECNAFEKWYDLSSDTMLPLQKSSHAALMDYLGLQPPYLSIMRSKKRATGNKTRRSNRMILDFLSATLFAEVDQTLFEDIVDSEINEILRLETKEELEELVNELRTKVKPQRIKR